MSARGARGESKGGVLLVVLFFTTFGSLIYQLVWGRMLSHVFGTSALAESTVLAVFMAGLALGSLLGGRMIRSSQSPWRFVALLELALGGSCLLALFSFRLLEARYQDLLGLAGGSSSYLFVVLLFLISSLILIVPTFLIGVAFPAIVHLYHHERERVGKSVGSCYMVDTIGGAAGLVLAAFFLIPSIGFLRVSILASAVNVLLGMLILWSSPATSDRHAAGEPTIDPSGAADRPLPSGRGLMLVLFFCSGFAALSFELIWIRHVSLIYGGSLHSFAIVVISFLLGLGLGALFHNLLLRQVVDKVRLLATLMLLIGLTSLVLTALFPRLEMLFLRIYEATDSYALLSWILGLICVGLLLVPTLMMGATLPVLSSIYASSARIGSDVGRLFAINSFGALFGSFVTGFFIIPLLGIEDGAFVAGGIYVCVALIFLFRFAASRKVLRRTLALFLVLGILAVPAYLGARKPRHLYNGVFYLATIGDAQFDYAREASAALDSLMFLKHSPHGQIAVYGENADSIVITNGAKIDASSNPEGLVPRNLLAHTPILLHDNARDVLAIGLGGGWTLAAMLRHDLDRAEVVEINQAVVEANRLVLPPYNDNALADPRAGIIVSDGRNYLANTDKRYDVIISEPPEIWVGGVSSLFTREFYESAKRALRTDGILCQWMPEYEMTRDDYRTALNTIKQAFPYVYEFDMQRITGLEKFREYMVIGSLQQLDVIDRLETRRFELGMSDIENREYLLEMIHMILTAASRNDTEVDAFIADFTGVNTDDLPILEFHTLRNRFRKFRPAD